MGSRREQIENALTKLPDEQAQVLRPALAEEGFRGVIPYAVAKEMAEELKLTMPQLMLWLVPIATAYAEPAISKFCVGAVVQGSSTQSLYFGANLEFPGEALSFTVHAEQAAITNAWNNGEEGVTLLAVSAAPCGYCRQFLYEVTTAAKLLVLLTEQPGKQQPLTSLLPEAFGPGDLLVTAALMSHMAHGLALDEPPQDPVVAAALAAANACYAPYTSSYAGVAAQASSGEVYAGRVAENAAFNPSISPLESALVMCSLAEEEGVTATRRVALVQLDEAIASQTAATEAVVASLRRSVPVTFETHGAHVA